MTTPTKKPKTKSKKPSCAQPRSGRRKIVDVLSKWADSAPDELSIEAALVKHGALLGDEPIRDEENRVVSSQATGISTAGWLLLAQLQAQEHNEGFRGVLQRSWYWLLGVVAGVLVSFLTRLLEKFFCS